MFQIVSGAGRYAGATGLLTSSPERPKRLDGIRIPGFICTP